MIELPLSKRLQVIEALVSLTPFLRGEHDKNRSSGVYREWHIDAHSPRAAHSIGRIPKNRVQRYHGNALKKIKALVGPGRHMPDEQYTLSWELARVKIPGIYQGGVYTGSVGIASAFSGLDAPVDEAVMLVKDHCLGYANEETVMGHAEISGNTKLVHLLMKRAESGGLLIR